MFNKQNMGVIFGEEMGIEILVKRDTSPNFHVLQGCIMHVETYLRKKLVKVTDGIFQRGLQQHVQSLPDFGSVILPHASHLISFQISELASKAR